jgi:ATP-dependent Lon protease
MDYSKDLSLALGMRLNCILFPLPCDQAFFPGEVAPFPVGDERIAWALRQALARRDAYLLAVPRRDVSLRDLDMPYEETGTLVTYQLLDLPDGARKVMLEGVCRARLLKLVDAENSLELTVFVLNEPPSRPLVCFFLQRLNRTNQSNSAIFIRRFYAFERT